MESKKLPGTAMEELVQKDKLERIDVLVTRSKGSLLGKLIRFGTRSYWNHALMVFVIRDPAQGYNNTFIIESGGAGIDIHNISHYFERPKTFDVGIKRLKTDWLTTGPEIIDFQRKIRGLALEEIDDKYDHRMILNIARTVIRQLILAFLYTRLRFKPEEKRRPGASKVAEALNVNAYICSGFVQWAYYTAAERALGEGPEKDKISNVIFNPEVHKNANKDVLLSTTPADIANSDKLRWKYIIKDGVVWEIARDDEVSAILAGR